MELNNERENNNDFHNGIVRGDRPIIHWLSHTSDPAQGSTEPVIRISRSKDIE